MPCLPKGQACQGCPRFDQPRLTVSAPQGKTQVLFVVQQPDSMSVENGQAVSGHGGRVISLALKKLQMSRREYQNVTYGFTYAVQCTDPIDDAPGKTVMQQCRTNLLSIIQRLQPTVIVAMGAHALKQLGVTAQFSTLQHKFTANVQFKAPIFVSFPEKQLVGAPGVFETFVQNLRNVFDHVLEKNTERFTLEELARNYRTPKTIDEAIEVCKEILAYTDEGLPAANWTLSVDTETNTLRAEKETAKIIAFCFGWAKGRATTILYDHPHAGEEYLARLPELREWIAKILESSKPKIFHNAKFDLKFIELHEGMTVNAVAWCTLLGEHLLDEDKKGNYGLKGLTANFLRRYCGYEDQLYDLLTGEDVSRADETEKEIADLTPIIESTHPEYLRELAAYREELVRYDSEKAENEAAWRTYNLALDDYAYKKSQYQGRVAVWEVETADWPKGQRGKPPKPTRAFSKPEKPVALKEPKKPKDPRTKKEQEVSRDAGFENIPLHELQVYGAVDGDVTRQLAALQKQRILAEGSKVAPLMKTHAIPLSRELGRMEYEGMCVDLPYMEELDVKLREVVARTEAEIYDMAGRLTPAGKPMNLNHAGTLANVLFSWGVTHPDGSHIDPFQCTTFNKKSGQPSTGEKILRQFIEYEDEKKTTPTRECLFVERLLQYRKASKALNTFLANIRALSRRDGRLHTQFHLNGTGTGRLSSSDMNMQNLPKLLSGVNLKQLFIPDDDSYLFVNVDYKGAEVRVFTAYAKDKALIQALNDGMDMHSFFASKVFQRAYEDFERRSDHSFLDEAQRKVLAKQRDNIKRVVFGILYGAGAPKLAETIGISEHEAEKLVALLYQMFPDLERYAKLVEAEVDRHHYVETLFGRRRRFPLATLSRHRRRAHRQARNFKIQSTSSDIVLGQLVEMAQPLRSDFGGRMLLTVHDSLVFQYPKRYISQLSDFVQHYAVDRVREKYNWLPVPFQCDIEVGRSYGETQSIESYLQQNPLVSAPEGVIEEYEILAELRDAVFESVA